MRSVVVAVTLLAALGAASGRPAWAQGAGDVAQAQHAPGGVRGGDPHAAQPAAEGDSAMRTMYVSMGAMTGYMFAVMPVTMTAVTAAVASGVVTMWAYDYLIVPNGVPVH